MRKKNRENQEQQTIKQMTICLLFSFHFCFFPFPDFDIFSYSSVFAGAPVFACIN